MILSPYCWPLPSTRLEGSSASNDNIWYASADMQAWRKAMHDRHKTAINGPADYFGLFDGHGGSNAARYASWYLYLKLFDLEAYRMQQYPEALKTALIMIDKEICSIPPIRSGSTALVALVADNTVYIANVGDSRAVICTAGRAKDLSQAHTTSQEEERDRILKAGGFIKNDRVCGMVHHALFGSYNVLLRSLAMTRSLGDVYLKKQPLPPEEQMVTAVPDITVHHLQSEDEFLVLASDGIWDCFSSQEVINIIRYQISLGATLTQACAFICNACLTPTYEFSPRGTDNMTIIVIAFLQGRTVTEWMGWVAERVQTKKGHATPSSIRQIHGAIKPIVHPARITTDFDFTLPPPSETFPPAKRFLYL